MTGDMELMSKKTSHEIMHSLTDNPFDIDCSTKEAAIFATEIINYLQATNWIIYETSSICGGDLLNLEFKKKDRSLFLSLEHCNWIEISICDNFGNCISSFSQSPLTTSIEQIAKRKPIID